MRKIFVVKLDGEDVENIMKEKDVEELYKIPISDLLEIGFSIGVK